MGSLSTMKQAAQRQRRTAGRPRRFTQEQILEAALEVMEREGFAALTLSSLAKHMKVSHSVLYKYVTHIEALELAALDHLAATLPVPRPGTPREIRAQALDALLVVRKLLLKHPGLLYPPIDSMARKTFGENVVQWILVLTPFATSAQAAVIGHGALVSMVALSAETERHLGPDFATRAQQQQDTRLPQLKGFQHNLEYLLDALFPGFQKLA